MRDIKINTRSSENGIHKSDGGPRVTIIQVPTYLTSYVWKIVKRSQTFETKSFCKNQPRRSLPAILVEDDHDPALV
jgi:hypothetical protein